MKKTILAGVGGLHRYYTDHRSPFVVRTPSFDNNIKRFCIICSFRPQDVVLWDADKKAVNFELDWFVLRPRDGP